jgi:hypothetical protein
VFRVRRLAVALVLLTAAVGVTGSAQAVVLSGAMEGQPDSPDHLENMGDFNGDGWPDLVAGAPEDDVLGKADAGTVNVLYGSPNGIRLSGNQFWTQSKTGVGTDDKGDFFGRSAATGDFNSDGYDDLSIAAIRKRVGTANHAGAVYVLYGTAGGLRRTGAQYWDQDTPGVPDVAGAGDLFGGSLHGADWNNDGYDDLAIGAWCDTIAGFKCSGNLTILSGGPAGLTTDGVVYFDQSMPDIEGTGPGLNNQFGRQTADGDYNGDGWPDISIGDRLMTVNGHLEAGAVNVIYGSPTGLTLEGNQFFTEDSQGMAGNGATDGDWFGRPVTTADFDADGYDDLLVGARFETVEGLPGAGAVFVLYGSSSGLSTTGSQRFHEGTPGLASDGLEADDNWGHQAGAGDFDNDGYDDVAVNAIDEVVNGLTQAGGMTVMYGRPSGLGVARSTWWTQDTPGVPGDVVEFGWFSFYIWSKDFTGDGYDDIAVSAPGATIDGLQTAGMVMILKGSAQGIVSNGARSFDQSMLKGNGAGEHDLFGGILA